MYGQILRPAYSLIQQSVNLSIQQTLINYSIPSNSVPNISKMVAHHW